MNSGNGGDGYLVSKRHAYFAFTLLFLLYMFDYIDRLVVVSLFPFLKSDWGLSDTQCGMLVSAVYWSILVFTFPVSLLVDRWSRSKGIGLMAVLWSIATAACAFTRNFRQLFVARTAIGIGEAGYAPGGTSMIAALFPEEKRSMFVGIWTASIPLGSALGIAIGGNVAEIWGWRHAFGLVALPGLIVALLFFRVKDYKTVQLVKTAAENSAARQKMKVMDMVRVFTRTKSLLFTYLGFAGNTFVTTALLSWLPTYFHRAEGIPMSKASVKGGSIMLLAIIGAPLGGLIADRWQKKRKNARLLFSAITSSLSALVLYAAFSGIGANYPFFILIVAGITVVAFVPAAAAVTQDVVHPGLRATSYSLCVIVQHILGSTLGPIFVGAVSDRYDLATGLSLLPIFTLVAGVLFFIGSFFYAGDLEKVEKIQLKAKDA